MLANISRNIFLYASKNKTLNKLAKKWGFRFGASQVVAGHSIEKAIQKVRELNERGLVCTLDYLGEFVLTEDEALQATNANIDTLKAIYNAGVKSTLSVKLTQIGLDIDRNFCVENMKRILDAATLYHNFVRIDMEDYAHCSDTLDILRELRQTYDNVGTVIQAYLHRSLQDVKDLQGISLRLVKGAYQEAPSVAYQSKNDIDQQYLQLIENHLLSNSYSAIATHDHLVIDKVKAFTKKHDIQRDAFEFQMLYGFRTEMQQALAQEGYQMRVYLPFGEDWFGYFMRRLAERPQNVLFAFKGLFYK